MSADKYAQFIAEQQRKLSVSGTNAVELTEKKHMSKADIAALKEPKDKFDEKDLEALRNKEHLKKEEVEQIDELTGKGKLPEIEDTHRDTARRMRRALEVLKNRPEDDSVRHTKKVADKAQTKADRAAAMNAQAHFTRLSKTAKSGYKEDAAASAAKFKKRAAALKKKQKANEEVELDDTMIEENVIELAEAMKKGELGEKSRFHRENAKYHEKMSRKHAVMADKAEQMGDENGFDHHYGEAIHHEMEAGRHHNLADRADALRDKVKARKDAKDASERLGKANAARRDMGY